MRRPIAILLAVWLCALAAFIVAAFFAANHDRFPGDLWLARQIQDIDGTFFDRLLDWTEDFADWPLLAVIIAAGALAMFWMGDRAAAALLVLSTLGRLVNSGVKELVERPRPTADQIEITCLPNSTYSFPSGHSEGSFVLFGLIFYFAGRYLPNPWFRLPVQAICVWIVLGTGIERVYAGCHWPSDVLGGYYFGFLVLAVVIVVHRLVIAARKE